MQCDSACLCFSSYRLGSAHPHAIKDQTISVQLDLTVHMNCRHGLRLISGSATQLQTYFALPLQAICTAGERKGKACLQLQVQQDQEPSRRSCPQSFMDHVAALCGACMTDRLVTRDVIM